MIQKTKNVPAAFMRGAAVQPSTRQLPRSKDSSVEEKVASSVAVETQQSRGWGRCCRSVYAPPIFATNGTFLNLLAAGTNVCSM